MWIAIRHCEQSCLLCAEWVSEGVTPFEAPFLNFVFALVKQIYSWSRLQLNAVSICSHQRKQYLDNEHHVQIGFGFVRKEVKILLKICIHIINDRVAEDLIWSEVCLIPSSCLLTKLSWQFALLKINKASYNTAKEHTHWSVFGCPFRLFLRNLKLGATFI